MSDEGRILRQNPRAWGEGYRAGLLLGLSRTPCPHSLDTTASWVVVEPLHRRQGRAAQQGQSDA